MNAIFTGRKRSGKTTLAFDLAMRNDGGIIVFDPKREWRGWPGRTSDVSEIEGIIKDHNEIIVFHPEGDTEKAFTALADYVLQLHRTAMEKGWDKAGYHFTFIVDEAVSVSTAKRVNDKLVELVAQNRPEILSIFLTFQSPKDANNLLKSRVDNWYVFNTSLPSDLEYLNKEVGLPQADLELISNLRPHEYAHFYFDGGSPQVSYEYDPDSWFRPLEYSELNASEREEVNDMSRERDRDTLQDLLDDFADLKDRIEDALTDRDRDRRGSRRDRDDDRERDRRDRRRDREYRLSGYKD